MVVPIAKKCNNAAGPVQRALREFLALTLPVLRTLVMCMTFLFVGAHLATYGPPWQRKREKL